MLKYFLCLIFTWSKTRFLTCLSHLLVHIPVHHSSPLQLWRPPSASSSPTNSCIRNVPSTSTQCPLFTLWWHPFCFPVKYYLPRKGFCLPWSFKLNQASLYSKLNFFLHGGSDGLYMYLWVFALPVSSTSLLSSWANQFLCCIPSAQHRIETQ